MSGLICPCCKTLAPQGAIYCDNCGYDLRTASSTPGSEIHLKQSGILSARVCCQNCGFDNIGDSVFCENCGSRLIKNETDPGIRVTHNKSDSIENSPPVEVSVSPGLSQHPSGVALEPAESVVVHGHLLIVKDGITITLPEGHYPITIGRDDPASGIFPDINLEPYGALDAGVGRRHAKIIYQSSAFLVEDMGSVNGTFINREKLSANTPREICSGDELRLGKMTLLFMLE